jgi:hypothetical protein
MSRRSPLSRRATSCNIAMPLGSGSHESNPNSSGANSSLCSTATAWSRSWLSSGEGAAGGCSAGGSSAIGGGSGAVLAAVGGGDASASAPGGPAADGGENATLTPSQLEIASVE